MRFNRNFAKTEDGKNLVYAPAEFDFEGKHYNATNREEVYNGIGFYKFGRSDAPGKEGFYYTPYYEYRNNVLYQRWEEHEIEFPAEVKEE